eukprot:3395129-Lingulodinium_polyedra.AAC.1
MQRHVHLLQDTRVPHAYLFTAAARMTMLRPPWRSEAARLRWRPRLPGCPAEAARCPGRCAGARAPC